MNQRLLNLSLLLALSGAVANCGSEGSISASLGSGMTLMQPIVGGQPIEDDQYSAVGALVVSLPGYNSLPFCTGTLLAPDVVLTASHCLDEIDEFKRLGGVLSFSLSNDIRTFDDAQAAFASSTFEIATQHPHYRSDFVVPPERLEACDNPAYDFVGEACGYLGVCLEYTGAGEACVSDAFQSILESCEPYRELACSFDNSNSCTEPVASWCFNLARKSLGLMGLAQLADIGLVFLDREILDVAPAQLIDERYKEELRLGEEVQIVGYGQQSPEPQNPGTGEKMAALTVVGEVGVYEVKIGGSANGVQQCYGDSGGPTFMNVMRGDSLHPVVLGIVSRTYDTLRCEKGAINTRTSPYLGWIQSEMTRACNDGLRQSCESHPFAEVFRVPEDTQPQRRHEAKSGCAATKPTSDLSLVWIVALLLGAFRGPLRRRVRL